VTTLVLLLTLLAPVPRDATRDPVGVGTEFVYKGDTYRVAGATLRDGRTYYRMAGDPPEAWYTAASVRGVIERPDLFFPIYVTLEE